MKNGLVLKMKELGREWRADLGEPAVLQWHLSFFGLIAGCVSPWIVRLLGWIAPGVYDAWVLPFWFDGALVGRWAWWTILVVLDLWRGGPTAPWSRCALAFVGGALFGAGLLYDWWYYAPFFMAALWLHLLWRQLVTLWAFPFSGALSQMLLSGSFGLALFFDGAGGAWIDRRLGMGYSFAIGAVLIGLFALSWFAIATLLAMDRLGSPSANRRRLRALIEHEPRLSEYFEMVRRITPRDGLLDPWLRADAQFPPAIVVTVQREETQSVVESRIHGAVGRPLIAAPALGLRHFARPQHFRIWLESFEQIALAHLLLFCASISRRQRVARLFSFFRPSSISVAFPSAALIRVLTSAQAEARAQWRAVEIVRLSAASREPTIDSAARPKGAFSDGLAKEEAENSAGTNEAQAVEPSDEAEALVRYVSFSEALIEAQEYFLAPRRLELIDSPIDKSEALFKRWSPASSRRRVAPEKGPTIPVDEWKSCGVRYGALWCEIFAYERLSWYEAIAPIDDGVRARVFPVNLTHLLTTWICFERANLGMAADELDGLTLRLAAAFWCEIAVGGAKLSDETAQRLRTLAHFLRHEASRGSPTGELLERLLLPVALTAACYVQLGDSLRAMWVFAPFESALRDSTGHNGATARAVMSVAACLAAWTLERQSATAEENPEDALDFGVTSFVFNRYSAVTINTAERARSALRFVRGLP